MTRMNVILIAAVLAAAGCGHKDEAATVTTPPSPPVKGVKVLELSLTKVSEDREAMGTVRPSETVALSTKLMGKVKSLPVKVGTRVKKGQTVARIDASDIESMMEKARAGMREADEGLSEIESAALGAKSAIKAAEANRDLAKVTFERFNALFGKGSISRQELDEAEARYKAASAETERASEMLNTLAAKKRQILAKKDQARADLETLKANMAYDTVTSPVDGTVVAKPYEEGMLAAPGAPLVMVEKDGALRLEAMVEESAVAALKTGDEVKMVFDALGKVPQNGRINEISPVADQATRTALVKISIPDQKNLRSGYFGRAYFKGSDRDALLLPKAAIIERGQLTGVYLIGAGGVAHFTLVKTGRDYGESAEVLSGLDAGSKVAVEGLEKLSDGARVE